MTREIFENMENNKQNNKIRKLYFVFCILEIN